MVNIFKKSERLLILLVGFSYFNDIFDIMIFSSVRTLSLKSLGLVGDQLVSVGLSLLNRQLLGLLVGGFIWGYIADKIGRTKSLIGSIGLDAIANILNAFVFNIPMYAVLRFIAGIGLAGELGVGMTLVSENFDKSKRTTAGIFITGFGLLGGVFAGLLPQYVSRPICFFIGGISGLLILVIRLKTFESKLFQKINTPGAIGNISFGSYLKNFLKRDILKTYFLCIMSGIGFYLFTGIFITLSPELGKSFGIENVNVGYIITIYMLTFVVSDIIAGILSKAFKSRKKVIYLFLAIQALAILFYVYYPSTDITVFYLKNAFFGIGVGYWSVFVLNNIEQFGTNIRGFVSTSLTNLVRGGGILATSLFLLIKTSFPIVVAVSIVGIIFIVIAGVGTYFLKDKFENDLDFLS